VCRIQLYRKQEKYRFYFYTLYDIIDFFLNNRSEKKILNMIKKVFWFSFVSNYNVITLMNKNNCILNVVDTCQPPQVLYKQARKIYDKFIHSFYDLV
jgi:hypothetical protein